MEVQILNQFLEHYTFEDVLSGAPVEFADVEADKQVPLMTAIIHCCVNGPVSPHKETTFPIIGVTSIDEIVGHKISNNSLRKTCESVAKLLNEQGFHEGYMITKYGNFWPLNNFTGQ